MCGVPVFSFVVVVEFLVGLPPDGQLPLGLFRGPLPKIVPRLSGLLLILLLLPPAT